MRPADRFSSPVSLLPTLVCSESFRDPRGKEWQYTFNVLGQVQKDDDPADGHIIATRQQQAPAESYDLRDGTQASGFASRQDVIVYRVAAHGPQTLEDCLSGALLTGTLRIGPRLTPALGDLVEGRITIDTFVAPAAAPVRVDAGGGSVSGPDGVQFVGKGSGGT